MGIWNESLTSDLDKKLLPRIEQMLESGALVQEQKEPLPDLRPTWRGV